MTPIDQNVRLAAARLLAKIQRMVESHDFQEVFRAAASTGVLYDGPNLREEVAGLARALQAPNNNNLTVQEVEAAALVHEGRESGLDGMAEVSLVECPCCHLVLIPMLREDAGRLGLTPQGVAPGC